jgi:hypothetical protein
MRGGVSAEVAGGRVARGTFGLGEAPEHGLEDLGVVERGERLQRAGR